MRISSTFWKQVLPLPENCTIQSVVPDEDGSRKWVDLSTEGWSYLCLVWVTVGCGNHTMEDQLALLCADETGCQMLEFEYRILTNTNAGIQGLLNQLEKKEKQIRELEEELKQIHGAGD